MIIDGSKIAKEIRETIKAKCQSIAVTPKVTAFIVGDNPSSMSYLKMLEKSCKNVGFDYELKTFEESISEEHFMEALNEANLDTGVHGILVQMPLPKHIDKEKIIASIDPKKDVDGFHELNAGALFQGKNAMVPCTALAVMTILESLDIELTGKHVVVIGRSNVVGKPLSVMLTHKNATVTLCHSKTRNLETFTQMADIVVVAVGVPFFLKEDMVNEKTIVIDVGMNEVSGKLVGDCDYDKLVDKVQMITPVPGGVGPVTNAVLLRQVLDQIKGE